MPGIRVERPVVRTFQPAFAKEAAAWARRGGHAIYWESASRARLVVKVPREDDPHDLGTWSLLDLAKQRFTYPKTGPFRALATAVVPKDCKELVQRRAHRDSVWPGPTRKVSFDCLACGACCRDNRVILDDIDVERFTTAGRPDLLRAPYTKREDGVFVLRLLKNKDCRHLGQDNKCGIYALRPDACSTFPVASECCLYARQAELGITDGLAPHEA